MYFSSKRTFRLQVRVLISADVHIELKLTSQFSRSSSQGQKLVVHKRGIN